MCTDEGAEGRLYRGRAGWRVGGGERRGAASAGLGATAGRGGVSEAKRRLNLPSLECVDFFLLRDELSVSRIL